MKIAILADSLALPREDVGGDEMLEVTYPFLLDQSLRRQFGSDAPIVYERGMRRRTIEYVLDDWNEQVELKKPDVVIVHVGIVDCAPRVFLRREGAFVANIRIAWLRDRILKFAHDHRRAIVQKRRKVYVPLWRFEPLVEQVVQKSREAGVKSLVFINIIDPPDSVEERSPGFQKNVVAYNRVLEEQTKHPWVSLIDLNRMVHDEGGSGALTVDGIHLNERGHALLARRLEEGIKPLKT
jgi:lysophospholipase L1-like esterase